MEYYTLNGESEPMSLQDMIESDMRCDIDNILHSGNLRELNGLNVGFNGLNGTPTKLQIQGVRVTESPSVPTTVDLESSAGSELGNLSWLQNVQPQLQQVENTNPNLLVDPQTGIPIHQQHLIGQPVVVSVPTTPISQTPTQVQYVTISNSVNSVPQQVYIQHQTPQTQHNVVTQQQQYYQQYQQSPTYVQSVHATQNPVQLQDDKVYPKPVYSYSCLIAMALKNSKTGSLPVSEIYSFMIENFPYFKTAPDGWKNSVRHNLSLNKCFEKIENPKATGNSRKGCLWAMNPLKVEKMMDEIAKWRKKDLIAIKKSMAKPDILDRLERGEIGIPPSAASMQEDQTNENELISLDDTDNSLLKLTIASSELFNGALNSNLDLNDPALSELALQNGLWDDLNSEDLNFDLPITTSPFNLSSASFPSFSSPFCSSTSPVMSPSPKVDVVKSEQLNEPAVSVKMEPTEMTVKSEPMDTMHGSFVYTTTGYNQLNIKEEPTDSLSGLVRPTTPRTVGANS